MNTILEQIANMSINLYNFLRVFWPEEPVGGRLPKGLRWGGAPGRKIPSHYTKDEYVAQASVKRRPGANKSHIFLRINEYSLDNL